MNHPQPSHSPIICTNTNTMIMISLARMRQSNGYGSVRNEDIFKLHLGSGAGPSISIPCLLQYTSHIHPPKQTSKKKQKILKKRSNSQQIVSYCLGLCTQNSGLRQVDLELSPKRGRDKINRLRPRRNNTTENESYQTAWIHRQEPIT